MILYILAENLETRWPEVHNRGCRKANSPSLFDVADDMFAADIYAAGRAWEKSYGKGAIRIGSCCEMKPRN